MLAGLCLLTVTLYLKQRGKSTLYTGIPMVFMLVTTLTAMIDQISGFLDKGQHLLLAVDLVLLTLAVWLAVEAALALRRGAPEGDEAAA
jgi:carbon starvation protein